MRQKLNHEVGSTYKKPNFADAHADLNTLFIDIIATAVGLLGIFAFMGALAILPWSVL